MFTEEEFIDFKCPHCGETASFPESASRFIQDCPNCRETVIVPERGAELGRKLPLPIVTPRLKLRRLAMPDWKGLMELLANDDFPVSFRGVAAAGEEEMLRWLEADSHSRLTVPHEEFRLAIELQEGSRIIGYVSLWSTAPRQAMFDLGVHPAHQRKGFGLEAVDALLGFCFEGLGFHRVSARCLDQNAAARGLLEKLGMRREGEFIKDTALPGGGWANSVWYGALEEEYGADEPDGEKRAV